MKKPVMHITINQGPLRGNTITGHIYPALCGTTVREFMRSNKDAEKLVDDSLYFGYVVTLEHKYIAK
mgnify:FL=1